LPVKEIEIFDVSGKLIKEITFSSAKDIIKGDKNRCLSLKDKRGK